MKKRTKLILLLLSLCMLLTAFAGCGKKTTNDPAQDTAPTTTTGGGETEEVLIEPEFPDVTFYREIGVLQRDIAPLEEWNAEEENNAVLEQALIEKIGYLKDKYGIEFSYYYASDSEMNEKVANSIQSQFMAYDMISYAPLHLMALANKALLRPLQSVENVDLSNPWWSQQVNDRWAYKGNNFFVVGNSNLNANWRTSGVFFNKTLAERIGVNASGLYKLVFDHTWTLEKMLEFGELATLDSGDGTTVVTENDTFGVLQTNGWYPAIMGSGLTLASVDDEGKFVVNTVDQTLIGQVEKLINYMNDIDIALPLSAGIDQWNHFCNGKGLFLVEGIAVSKVARASDVDYGILPSPLGEAGQAEYHNFVHHGHSSATAVPTDVAEDDLTMIGALLEEANYISRKEIWPAFYNTLMKGQIARDPESAEVLDIIFDSMSTDIGIVYGDRIDNAIRDMVTNNKYSEVASTLGTKATEMQTVLDLVNEYYETAIASYVS